MVFCNILTVFAFYYKIYELQICISELQSHSITIQIKNQVFLHNWNISVNFLKIMKSLCNNTRVLLHKSRELLQREGKMNCTFGAWIVIKDNMNWHSVSWIASFGCMKDMTDKPFGVRHQKAPLCKGSCQQRWLRGCFIGYNPSTMAKQYSICLPGQTRYVLHTRYYYFVKSICCPRQREHNPSTIFDGPPSLTQGRLSGGNKRPYRIWLVS